jgi:formate dehydrogenase iron-sulfur subunit
VLDRLIEPFRRGVPPQARPATGFYTDTTVCIGCKACEVACKQWNQLPADGFDWTGNSYDNTRELSATSWRHVKFIEQFAPTLPYDGEPSDARIALDVLPDAPQESRWLMMSDVCKHCTTAPCQQACPTGAIIHNEFENVYIQSDICNGCSYCIAACPFGVITRASFDGHSHKCTLCYDRQRDGLVPACAKACPTQSIQFGPIDELRERARQRVEELHRRGVATAYLYGAEPTARYSELHSFYLLIDRPSTYGLPETPSNPWLHMAGDYVRAVVGGLAAIAVLLATLLLRGH